MLLNINEQQFYNVLEIVWKKLYFLCKKKGNRENEVSSLY